MRLFSVVIAVLFLGCGQQVQPSPSASPAPSLGDQVPLLTGRNLSLPSGECITNSMSGVLTVEPTYGTAMASEDDPNTKPPSLPIMWPIGYTGYRVGSGVAVVDITGRVVAITGNRYRIIMGGLSGSDPIEPPVPGAYLSCGAPLPWPPASSGPG